MRAILLAAGAGSRLWPYTATRPKPMVPVAGRPIIAWLLDALADAGIDDVQIVVGYKGKRIRSAIEDGRDFNLNVSYARQEVLLGSGAALATALNDGGTPEKALVMGADNIVDTDLIQALLDTGPNALALARTADPSKYGVVQTDNDHVTHIEEKPPIQGQALVSTGAALLDADTLNHVPDLVDDGLLGLAHILNHLAQQGQLKAVNDQGHWLDAVYPWDLLQLTDALVPQLDPANTPDDVHATGPITIGQGTTIEPGAILRGPTSIGDNVHIGAGALITESIVMDDATIGPGTHIEKSIIGDGTQIHGGTHLAVGEGIADTTDNLHRLETIGALIGEGCTIEGSARILPATLIGNHATVRAGATARGRIPADGEVQ